MTDISRLEASTLDHEGFREHPYLDSKKLWTFGVGRCLETNPLKKEEWKHLLENGDLAVSITLRGATWLMRRELAMCEEECKRLFSFWPRLNDARRNVLVEMVYQMGAGSVVGFDDMITAIHAGDFDAAAEHGMDSKWARIDTPRRAQQLMKQLRLGEFPVLGGSHG